MALRLRASSVALASVSWCVQVFVEPGDQLLSVPWLNLTQPSRFFSQSLKSIVMFRNLYCSYVCMYVCSHGHGHSHVDLVVDQLLDGREYSFTVRSCQPNLDPPQILSRRYHKRCMYVCMYLCIYLSINDSDSILIFGILEVYTHTHTYRAVTVRPGCYSALRSQCCGHGECVPSSTTEHQATCVCDAGFSGLHCDYYQVRVIKQF